MRKHEFRCSIRIGTPSISFVLSFSCHFMIGNRKNKKSLLESGKLVRGEYRKKIFPITKDHQRIVKQVL